LIASIVATAKGASPSNDQWFAPLGHGLGVFANILGAVVAAIALAATTRGWYLRTLGRRRDRYRRLARLATEVQISYITSILGEPPAIQRRFDTYVEEVDIDALEARQPREYLGELGENDLNLVDGEDDESTLALPGIPEDATEEELATIMEDWEAQIGQEAEKESVIDYVEPLGIVSLRKINVTLWESLYIDRDYVVQTIHNDVDNAVLAYSVTSRSKRFKLHYEPSWRPTFLEQAKYALRFRKRYRPLFSVRLGKTRLSAIEDPPTKVWAYLGNHNWSYSEAHYYGNPGYYQTFVLTSSNGGVNPPTAMDKLFPQGFGSYGGELRWGFQTDDPTFNFKGSYGDIIGIDEFRRRSAANSYTVIGVGFRFEDFARLTTFGPHPQTLRMV
jgi:hypothetical protein